MRDFQKLPPNSISNNIRSDRYKYVPHTDIIYSALSMPKKLLILLNTCKE